jgi:hypothetical protein
MQSKAKKPKVVSIDEIITGRIPAKIIEDIENITITIGEVIEWEENKKAVTIYTKGKSLIVSLHFKINYIKIIAFLGGAIGVIWWLIKNLK